MTKYVEGPWVWRIFYLIYYSNVMSHLKGKDYHVFIKRLTHNLLQIRIEVLKVN